MTEFEGLGTKAKTRTFGQMCRFCFLRTPSGLAKELCKAYYYAGRDVEQIIKWPVLRTKKLAISP